jgi:Family of unknown function (DUF6524)
MATDDQKDRKDLTVIDVLLRFLGPLAIVLITYNPTGYSFYDWFSNALAEGSVGGLHILVLVLLVIAWSILLIATWNALDTYGVILICALVGALVWVFVDWGLLKADSANAIAWILLICAAIVLAVGLSWAHIWRRITGQYAVDNIDD